MFFVVVVVFPSFSQNPYTSFLLFSFEKKMKMNTHRNIKRKLESNYPHEFVQPTHKKEKEKKRRRKHRRNEHFSFTQAHKARNFLLNFLNRFKMKNRRKKLSNCYFSFFMCSFHLTMRVSSNLFLFAKQQCLSRTSPCL